jgi:hypothetical protein
MEISGELHAQNLFPQYSLDMGLGGPKNPWSKEKYVPLPEI